MNGRRLIVHQQLSQIAGPSPTGMIRRSDRKLLLASDRNPSVLLLRKGSVQLRNNSARSPSLTTKKRRSRTNSRGGTRGLRSKSVRPEFILGILEI